MPISDPAVDGFAAAREAVCNPSPPQRQPPFRLDLQICGSSPLNPWLGCVCSPTSAASDGLGAVIERHRVFGLGEKQPAFDDEAQRGAEDRHRGGGHRRGEEREQRR